MYTEDWEVISLDSCPLRLPFEGGKDDFYKTIDIIIEVSLRLTNVLAGSGGLNTNIPEDQADTRGLLLTS